MKKERIYELIEKSFEKKNNYLSYLTNFIEKLKDEGYFEMAKIIENIKDNNTNIIYASNRSSKINVFRIFGEEIERDANLIKQGFNSNIIKSIFLFGETGTGKTTFVNLLQKHLKIPCVELRLSNIFNYRYGETLKNFEIFISNNMHSKQIIFIDEAESLFKERGAKNDVFESDRLLTIMLKLMDKQRKALIIFASNLIDKIDKAILRRFDMLIDFNKTKINYKRILKENLLSYNVNLNNDEYKFIFNLMKKYFSNPKLSEIKFLSKRIALEKLTNQEFNVIKKNLNYFMENNFKKSIDHEK